jgi:hypothetical protein
MPRGNFPPEGILEPVISYRNKSTALETGRIEIPENGFFQKAYV